MRPARGQTLHGAEAMQSFTKNTSRKKIAPIIPRPRPLRKREKAAPAREPLCLFLELDLERLLVGEVHHGAVVGVGAFGQDDEGAQALCVGRQRAEVPDAGL